MCKHIPGIFNQCLSRTLGLGSCSLRGAPCISVMVFSRRLFICRNKTPGTRYLASAFRRQLSERFFSGSAFRNGQFSVFVHNTQIPKPELQELVLGQVERYMKNFSRHLNKESDSTGGSLLFDLMTPPQRADSLVIVVSKELMHWITDSVFIPGLLGHLFKPSQTELQRNEKRQVVTVVVGVADGVGHSSPGISILHGERASIFSGTPQILRKTGQPCDKQSWLSFKLNPLAGATYLVPSLEATVPLANTIFNNEVPSVLVLSKWAIDPNASYCVGQDLILNQTIHPELVDAGCPTVGAVPVQAISPPRKVLSGLGNIVRQIEIDGSATHASEELERNVAKILQNSPESGPLRIWACMIPANLTNSREDQGAPFKEQDLSTLLARRDSGSLEPITPRNLVSEGCNLFQVCK